MIQKLNASKWAEAVPPAMRALPRWCGWRGSKQPLDPRTGEPARVDDPSTFGTFDDALRWYRRHESQEDAGAGFVFTAGDGLVFVDLDHCLDELGAPAPWAGTLLTHTYTEVSPSGRGLHLFYAAELPRAPGISGGRIEVGGGGAVEAYAERRFSTITGLHWAGKAGFSDPLRIANIGDALPPALRDKLLHVEAPEGKRGPEPLDRRREVWAAMQHLDPDMPHDQWVATGMALKDAFGDGGLPLWDKWSSRGAKYKEGEPAQRWHSFRRSGVGLGTLLKMARDAGWLGPQGEVEADAFELPRRDWWTITADKVEEEQVEWLVRDLGLARGYASLVAGDPGRGKSMLMVEVAARLSTGKPLPWESVARPPCRVAYLNAEDGASDTIRPRLRAAGANLSLVELLDTIGGSRVPTLPDHAEELEDYLRGLPDADLLVIDPLNAFLSREVDAHKAHDVRMALQPLGDALKRTRRATAVVAHLNKNEAASALYRVSGSADQVAFVRTAVLVGGDPDGEDEGLRVVTPLKWNLGPPPPSRSFRVVAAPEVSPDAGRVEWGEEVETTAEEVVARSPGGTRGRVADAEAWLRSALALSPRASRELEAEARAAGLSRATLNRAAKRLGVRRERDGLTGTWRWPRITPPQEVTDHP